MGDVRDRVVDVRLVAATHQELHRLIESKTFRSDLYFRISTVPLALPTLRSRQEDIPEIAATLLQRICSDIARPPVELSTKAIERLQSYYWPGNIRELRNVLERALLLHEGNVLDANHFGFDSPHQTPSAYNPNWTLEEIENFHIKSTLSAENGNVEKTAKRLGIAKSTLYQKMKAMNLS